MVLLIISDDVSNELIFVLENDVSIMFCEYDMEMIIKFLDSKRNKNKGIGRLGNIINELESKENGIEIDFVVFESEENVYSQGLNFISIIFLIEEMNMMFEISDDSESDYVNNKLDDVSSDIS